MGKLKSIGPYNLEEVIGHGGMGAVYRAIHKQTGRRVAIKVALRRGWAAMDQRFLQEAELLKKLEGCPNILGYIDHGEDGGTAYIAMELLKGQSLRECLEAQGGRLPEPVAVEIMRQTCIGVAYAHERKVLHRDLKPDNIFITKDVAGDLLVKIIDFGLAKKGIGAAAGGMTVAGVGLGTPMYMAPEQRADARSVDARADVFSLGCVLFEILTGKDLYRHGCQLGGIYPSFPKPTNVRQEIWDTLMHAASPDITRRQASVREFWEHLQRVPTIVIPVPNSGPSPMAQPAAQPAPRRAGFSQFVKNKNPADFETEELPPPPRKKVSRKGLMIGFVACLFITLGALMGSAIWHESQLDQPIPTLRRQTDRPQLPTEPAPLPVAVPTAPEPPPPGPVALPEPPAPAPRQVATHTPRPSSDVVGTQRTRRGYLIPHPNDWGEPDVIRSRPATCRGLRARGANSPEFHAFCDGH